ncbi:MAG: T9SS type A sorting domain-containing protein, partial [Cytophagales bacterium]|nr:T9SS type A sorting domain-containing protein [Cytophagales bacterium]
VTGTSAFNLSLAVKNQFGCTKTITSSINAIKPNPDVSVPTLAVTCANTPRAATTITSSLPAGDNMFISTIRTSPDIIFNSATWPNYYDLSRNYFDQYTPVTSTSIPPRQFQRTATTSAFSYVYHVVRVERANGCIQNKIVPEYFSSMANCNSTTGYRMEEPEHKDTLSVPKGAFASIYPNPFTNSLQIRSFGKEISSIVVYNEVGAKVATWEGLTVEERNLSTHGWANGLYIILVNFSDGTVQKEKMVRQE